MQIKNAAICITLIVSILLFRQDVYCQNYTQIPLPDSIRSVYEEFSGMTIWKKRMYLLPQYGSHKDTKLEGDFFIYSINCDSVGRVIDGKDTSLTAYKLITVKNLQRLPDTLKKYYEGFEAITIVNGKVFLSMETAGEYDSCFLLKGTLDTNKNEVDIDPKAYAALKRYPYISNAGLESIAYLPRLNKIMALYEYNGMTSGGAGFLADTAFKIPTQKIAAPSLYFRLSDIAITNSGRIYAINYYWNGDYNHYLNNNLQRHEEPRIKQVVPGLKNKLDLDPDYLKLGTTCFARIVMLNSYLDTRWKQVTAFECDRRNWEGLALFRKGALVISDANRSQKQNTTLAYIKF